MHIPASSLSSPTVSAPPAPQAAPAPADLQMSYNPQDNVVLAPGSATVPGVTAGSTLSTEKVKLNSKIAPNTDGSYVYTPDDKRHYAANAFAAANKALAVFEKAWGTPIKWATGRPQLGINADAGEDLNAYYSRGGGGLSFFHSQDKVTGEMVYSAGSGEVVAHETGHAMLDAIRPGYFSTWSATPGAFHESFGDMIALLVSLKEDRVLDKVAEQTNGDLKQPNLAAALGEQLGMAINHKVGHSATGGDYTRNAINTFTYEDPSTLPDHAPPDKLSSEVHSYSRLWTGAFYDVMAGVVQQKMGEGMSAREALAASADDGLAMLARMMKAAPEGDFTYPDMAKCLLKTEKEGNDGKYAALIQKVMTDRKILPEGQGMLDSGDLLPEGTTELSTTLSRPDLGPLQGAQVSTLLSGPAQRNMTGSDSEKNRLEADVARLWRSGAILMTEPNEVITDAKLIRPDGEPYIGVVRWDEGVMKLERVAIGG